MNKFNGSFLLILTLSAFALAVFIPVLSKAFHLLRTNTFYFCQKFVSNSFYYITHSFSSTLFIIIISALTLGLVSFFIQLYKTQKLVRKFSSKRTSIPTRAEATIVSLGLKDKVDIVTDNNLFSFCSGVFSPRIIITTNLVASLSEKELEAVLLHEKAHLKSHDPLKILLGKTISLLFFFLPIFKELYKNMNATNEILADSFAIRYQKDNSHLRRALRKILTAPQLAPAILPSISHPDYLEIRIHRLINPAVTKSFGVSLRNILVSISFIILSLAFIQTPVRAFQIETPAGAAEKICTKDTDFSAKQNSNSFVPMYGLPLK